jgi:HlyD family secretion protein
MRNRRIWIIILALTLLTGGALTARVFLAQRNPAASQWQTASLTQGDLTSTLSTNGSLRSNQTVNLNWKSSGIVDSVSVKAGDRVSTDQELAALSQDSLPQEIILAQVDLNDAQKALNDLYDPQSLSLAQAEKAVADAEKEVEDAEWMVKVLKEGPKQLDIDNAYAAMILAQHRLEQTQENITRVERLVKKNPKDYMFFESRDLYESILKSLKIKEIQDRKAYQNSQYKYEQLTSPVDPVDLSVAESNQTLAKAKLTDAQSQVEQIKSGPSANDIEVAQARVEAAKAFVDRYRLKAPIDGIITQVNAKTGDTVFINQPAIRLDDLSHILIDTQVSEVDINRVQVGQPATIKLDSVAGREYQGTVVEVPEAGQNVQGLVNFNVKVELTNPDEKTRPGMTANVDIVIKKVENVLQVPIEAVRLLNGKRVVYVLDANGQPQPVEITLGISSDKFSELKSGNLKAGDQVVLNPPS